MHTQTAGNLVAQRAENFSNEVAEREEWENAKVLLAEQSVQLLNNGKLSELQANASKMLVNDGEKFGNDGQMSI